MTQQPTSPPSPDDLLTAYALGVLSTEEMAQLSALLRERPELRQDLAALREVADALPYALPDAAPPPDLRARIVARAAGEAAPPARTTAPQRRSWWQRPWVPALSSGLAALFLALTIASQVQLAGQRAEVQRLQDQVVAMEGLTSERQQLIALLANPDIDIDIGTDADGNLTLVRSGAGDALVAQLPPLREGRTYQLWLIRDVNSQPNSAGTFDVDAEGRGLLVLANPPISTAEAQLFAVTNEPEGGSPAPTTDVLVLGQTAES